LQVHNYYRIRGGECGVVDVERELLSKSGQVVDILARHSGDVDRVRAREKGVEFFRIPWNRRAAPDVAVKVGAARPDVAHVHNVFPLLSPSVYAALARSGVPVVQTVHNFRFLCPNGLFFTHGRVCEDCRTRGWWSAVRNRCMHGSVALSAAYAAAVALAWRSGTFPWAITRFIALNQFVAGKLTAAGVPAERVRILGNFVSRFAESPGPRGDYVLYLGRLSPEKGLLTLLAASEGVPGVRVVIAGGGPLEGELREWIAAHAGTRVELAGLVGGEEKERLIREALCMVVPSEWYENFPLSVVESLAQGTPVVASRIGGLPEMVRDGVTGLLFEPGDADGLAGALRALVERAEVARAMGEAALAEARERFSPDRHLAGLLEIYEDAIAAVRRAA
jgi:glycosyltransferase involved in cell wall biosynthesis